jgi:hypothetical protein
MALSAVFHSFLELHRSIDLYVPEMQLFVLDARECAVQ